MRISILVSITLLWTSSLVSQVTNNNIEYHFELYSVDWVNTSHEGGNVEPAWRIKTRTSGEFSDNCNSDNFGDFCVSYQDQNLHFPQISIRHAFNVSKSLQVFYKVLAWENDDIFASHCTHDGGDDFLHCGRGRPVIGNQPQGWHLYPLHNVGNKSISHIRIRQFWSFHHGQWGETPLNFGTISHNSSKSHSNRIERFAQLGYTSTFDINEIQGGNNFPYANSIEHDVTYSFVIEDDPKMITIDGSSSTLAHHLILVRQIGNSWEYVATNDADHGDIQMELCPGSYRVIFDPVYNLNFSLRRTGNFNLSISAAEQTLVAGSIEHPKPFVESGCEMSTPVITDQAASVSFGTIEYSWQKRPKNSNTWQIIPGATSATLATAELGVISDDLDVRRAVNVTCGTTMVYSNILTFDALTTTETGGRGLISGKITGLNGFGEIDNVTIYAIPDEPINGACPNQIYSAVSRSNGTYDIAGIYHGLDTTSWTVYPVFLDHGFSPDSFKLDLFPLIQEIENVDFQDTSTIFVSGRLFQVDDQGINEDTCGIPDVGLFLNDASQFPKVSDEDGHYNLDITIRDENNLYVIRPDATMYQFDPIETPVLEILQDIDNVDFENEQRETLEVSVQACGMFCFGKVDIRVRDVVGGCFEYLATTNSCGYVEFDLPVRPYEISIVGVDESSLEPGYIGGEILQYFNNIQDTVDMRGGMQSSFFVYRQGPVIEIQDLPIICTDTVFTQAEAHELTILVTEENTNGCPIDTGLLRIFDGVSDRAPISLPISQGIAKYTVFPGEPNIFASTGYRKTISFIAEDIDDPNQRDQVDLDVIVQGNKARNSTFTTVSPDIPLLILRDPPGDKSYSYVSSNESSQFGMSFSMLRGGSVENRTKVKAGIAFESGIGFITENVVLNNVTNEVRVTAQSSTTEDVVWTLTTNETYQTNMGDDVIGPDADLFVTAALNLRYAITDVRTYNDQTCMIEESEDLMIGTDSIRTLAVRTRNSIENTIIPQLIELRDIQGNPDSAYIYNNQIETWQQIILLNEKLKAEAIPDTIPNISWDGAAGEIRRSTTKSSITSNVINFGLDIESSIAAELGFSISGVGLENTVTVRSQISIGGGITNVETSERTHGFVLDDDDTEDFFETEIFFDPTYSTPVFKNTSSGTTCPYEQGSLIDNAILSVDRAVITDVPFSDTAVFNFTITNGSELPDSSQFSSRTYYLDIDDASNSYSAAITSGGDGNFPLKFEDIPRGASVSRLVGISRPLSNTFTLEGLRFTVRAECNNSEADVLDDQEVTVYFNSTCSSITMASPVSGWLINQGHNNSLDIEMSDYDKSLITDVVLEYSRAGVNSWEDGPSITGANMGDNNTFINWNTSDIADGSYDIRLRLTCVNGINYTERVTGRIDRAAPLVFGIPSPADDIYDQSMNDRISAAFTETLNCDNASIILMNMETEEEYDAILTCANNEAEIVPVDILDNFDPAAYRVILSGVEDLYGNISETHRWAFIVGDYIYDPDCSPIEVSNNNIEQDAISQSVYRAMTINSDGTVVDGTQIGYRASESVSLGSGFTVNEGGVLEASIELCED